MRTAAISSSVAEGIVLKRNECTVRSSSRVASTCLTHAQVQAPAVERAIGLTECSGDSASDPSKLEPTGHQKRSRT